jgi:hypothetical protein
MDNSLPFYYTQRIRGNALNEIVTCGNYGFLAHYNGIDWNVYQEFLQLPNPALLSVSLNGDVFAAVGFSGEKAIIIVGKRN